jgi:hypothetical protein
MRCWLKGEPKLRDVLSDPVIQLMMRRDRVDPDHLHAFLRNVRDARIGADFRRMGFADLPRPREDMLAR